ncbi:hypothetical protein [Bacillus manliponensis]|uniref:Uncharacterized protein n=1 Tax=Bacillus manliponensis TaxID=574376 RepID=A0A073K411_9BACI|nr:hypothetical protein [Bacillus manliponensis]KEK21207.1 hypothetical protein BAMA_00080 [Bacillus manliponensis]
MEFLVQDAIFYMYVITTALCLLDVFLYANVSRFVSQKTCSGRQRTFAVVHTCKENDGHRHLFSIFYKYGMIRSIRRQQASDESDETGPYVPMFR